MQLANVAVTGATRINLGGGNDEVEILDAVFNDAFNLGDASGKDTTTIANTTFNTTATVKLGSGKDSIGIDGSSFARAVTLNLGKGTDSLDAGTLGTPVGATRGNSFVEEPELLGIEAFLS